MVDGMQGAHENVNMETDANIELGDAATHDCHCCGKKSETVHGFLYGRDGATSVYFAGYTHGHPERRANMLLSVGGWREGTTEADRRAVALQATAEAGRVTFNFPPPETSPWFGKVFLGSMQSPDELSDDERRRLVTMAQIIVNQDPRVGSYFTSG